MKCYIESKTMGVAISRLMSMGELYLLKSDAGLYIERRILRMLTKWSFDSQGKLVYQIMENGGNKGI